MIAKIKYENERKMYQNALKQCTGCVSVIVMLLCLNSCNHSEEEQIDLPNILWITCEDISANLGVYGDAYAVTPNLDNLANDGIAYTQMYANAPACSPARSTIITGVYASSLGTQNLRSVIKKPDSIRFFTEYLRQAGYYCSNNAKEDYQMETPDEAWDDSSREGHWRNRPKNAPFFSVFNLFMTHQSQTRYTGQALQAVNDTLEEALRHDPSKAPIPPYYPDTKLVRENIAAYYNQISIMDRRVGEILAQLEEDGLADNTIVMFFSDHGAGLPRSKRWLHKTGLHVPFIVRCPEKYRHLLPETGSLTDRLVSFIDLAPTLLNLADIPIPDYMQGQYFMGKNVKPASDYVFGFRDRIDEAILVCRSVADNRYRYIRNFLPYRPRMPWNEYSEVTPIRTELRHLHASEKLVPPEDWLVSSTTPPEEFYDLSGDPYEINNLIGDSSYQQIIQKMRDSLYSSMLSSRDLGLFMESQMYQRVRQSPYEEGQALSDSQYRSIVNTAMQVGIENWQAEQFMELLESDPDPAVKFWAASGLIALEEKAEPAKEILIKSLDDPSGSVRIAAAEALCNIDQSATAIPVLVDLLDSGTPEEALEAATALLAVGKSIAPFEEPIRAALGRDIKNLSKQVKHILRNLEQ